MVQYAKRIHALREQAGLSQWDISEALGINLSWAFDLDEMDNELPVTLDLCQVNLLAKTLRVTLRQLLSPDEDFMRVGPQVISFSELRDRIQAKVDREGLAATEDAVGWILAPFLANAKYPWQEPLIFLEAVCDALSIPWIDAVPDNFSGES